VRSPKGLFGIIDINKNTIIDFSWFKIDRCCGFGFDGFVTFISQRGKSGDYRNIYSVPMKKKKERRHDQIDGYLYSLFSKDGRFIVGDLDCHPLNTEWTFESYMHHDHPRKEKAEGGAHFHKIKAIESLGNGATDRYLIVRRNEKFGVIAEEKLLQEPTLEWMELWSVIEKDWESRKQSD